jgi:hypothetical protein
MHFDTCRPYSTILVSGTLTGMLADTTGNL